MCHRRSYVLPTGPPAVVYARHGRSVMPDMKVIPTAAVLGAEIAGVDLSRRLDDPTFAAIVRAYDEYAVIFFRWQSITPTQQVAFTRRFGEIDFNILGERWRV